MTFAFLFFPCVPWSPPLPCHSVCSVVLSFTVFVHRFSFLCRLTGKWGVLFVDFLFSFVPSPNSLCLRVSVANPFSASSVSSVVPSDASSLFAVRG
ncbi:MAG: hypothetical protein D6679_04565 [Candidatus Hydrogenedentota bacterium]|nr:MAG: hypothetical protein D6679_04565 [Candidatus Hydrogenedentota bacterium]